MHGVNRHPATGVRFALVLHLISPVNITMATIDGRIICDQAILGPSFPIVPVLVFFYSFCNTIDRRRTSVHACLFTWIYNQVNFDFALSLY